MTVPHVDRQTFLTNLRQSGLVSAEQLAAAAAQLPETPRGRVLARALVEMGLLTRFQAEQLLAGRTAGFFLDQYRILEQLGQGGMGRVYKAEHRTLGRTVALKVLAPTLLRTERAQDLFLREVRAVAQLVHPNIVTAFDASQAAGRYYLVLEYINGPNLDQLVRDKGPLPVGRACDFLRQVAAGLQHAAAKGMVHRDIKPANLLLQHGAPGGSDVVKISDFGLARLNDPDAEASGGTIVTREHTVMGTPDYLSPEQARDLHQTDIRSDLYSLGCTFYYLLTGRVPFPGGNTLEKLIRHSTEEPVPAEQRRRDLPPGVLGILRRLMAKSPADRFQTPQDLAEALAPFARSGPVSWSGPRRAVPYVDPLATPEADVHAALSGDEGSALAATLPPDASPTPVTLPGTGSGERSRPVPGPSPDRRVRLALLWALGIVGGLLATGVALGVMLAGR